MPKLAPAWVQYAIAAIFMFGYTIFSLQYSRGRVMLVSGIGVVLILGTMSWYSYQHDESPLKSQKIRRYIGWYIVILVAILAVVLLI